MHDDIVNFSISLTNEGDKNHLRSFLKVTEAIDQQLPEAQAPVDQQEPDQIVENPGVEAAEQEQAFEEQKL